MKIRLTLTAKKAISGYMFILPFIIGFLFLFLYPLTQTILYSFSDIKMSASGYWLEPRGLANYRWLLFENADFRRVLVETVRKMVIEVPVIVIFSFFAANLLNQKFKGRTFARSIFFLPVVLASGIIMGLEANDLMLQTMRGASEIDTTSVVNLSSELRKFLLQSQISTGFVIYIFDAIDKIYDIVIASGMQMLIFLAGLQTIPPSLFEASNIEGATGWENFWKITFPMVSPLILVSVMYSIIDSFTKTTNAMMKAIETTAFINGKYGYSSAMACIYFLVIITILAIVTLIISKNVFYYDK